MNRISISWSFFLTSENLSLLHHLLGHVRKKRNTAAFPLYLSLLPVSLPRRVQHSILLQIAVKAHDDGSQWVSLVGHRCQRAMHSLELIFSQVYSQRIRDDLSLLAASCTALCRSSCCLALSFISLDNLVLRLQIHDSQFSLIKPLINGCDISLHFSLR